MLSAKHLPRLVSRADLCAYLGRIQAEELLPRIAAHKLPEPLWGVKVDDPAARWDVRAVDRSLDSSSGLRSVEDDIAALDRALGIR